MRTRTRFRRPRSNTLENHDHERFLCNFGLRNPDEAGNPLFAEGDRNNWYMVQPYLIGLLMGKGVPLLWQGQEFGENYFLPDFGEGRVSLLRPLRWDFFYDAFGQQLVRLVRTLLRIRRDRPHIRHGAFYFFNNWNRYQQDGVLLFARFDGPRYSLVALNFGDVERQVPFWFPVGGELRRGTAWRRSRPESDRPPSRGWSDDPVALRPGLDCRGSLREQARQALCTYNRNDGGARPD